MRAGFPGRRFEGKSSHSEAESSAASRTLAMSSSSLSDGGATGSALYVSKSRRSESTVSAFSAFSSGESPDAFSIKTRLAHLLARSVTTATC